MGARRSAAIALAALAGLAATASAASVPSSVKTFTPAHGKAVVVHHATAAPSAAPTPCLIKFDCSFDRTVAASCPTVVTVPVPCGGVGGAAHGTVRANFGGATCLIKKTVVRPCQKAVTVARTCVKACPTPTPTPTPTPCLIKFNCSFNRTVAASCPTVVTVPVPCGGVGTTGAAHGTVRANFGGATCLIEKTVVQPCQKAVTVARTCVKACPTPTPTPCTVEVACTKVVEVEVERKVAVPCPNTAQFFDADGKALAVCQTIQKVVEEQTVAATCVQACAKAAPRPTAGTHTKVVIVAHAGAPKATAAAAAHGKKGFLGVPTKAWVGLLGKALVGLKGGKQGGGAMPSPMGSPTSPAAPGTGGVSAGNGGNGGEGGAGEGGADGGEGGAGGNVIAAP